MLKIRLQRVGRKHEPVFRVIATEHTNAAKTGRVLEILGNYDPRVDNVVIKADRVNHWISVGAKPTDTMHNLLVSKKIIEGKKRNVLSRKSPIKSASAPATAETKPASAETATGEAKKGSGEMAKEEVKVETKAPEASAAEEVTEAPVSAVVG